MARELKISMETGKVSVPGLPKDEDSAEVKAEACTKLLAEAEKEVEQLEERVAQDARGALKGAWVLHTVIEEHPNKWLKDFALRRARNDLLGRLLKVKERACAELPEDIGKQIWDDLPYIRETLSLLFDKLKASGEVKRMILTPLGNLEFAQIKYQRDSAEDLARVCRDISEKVRAGSDIDDEVKTWGALNREALLYGKPPVSIPAGMVGSSGGGVAALLLGLAGLGAGGAILAGVVPAVPVAGGAVALLVGVVLAGVGGMLLSKVAKQKQAAPEAFAKLSARFRERLYLVCALRNLYAASSRLTVTNTAFDEYLRTHGGKARWKRVKFEARDLTELFATETWHERGTVEHWLGEKVTKVFRLESTTLAAPSELDDETWDIIHKAYLLESAEGAEGSDNAAGELLASVGDLLFTKRGEDVDAERARVFATVEDAWQLAEREGRTV